MADNYTRSEAKTIREAFGMLEYIASRHDTRSEYDLREAFKLDKRERGCPNASRACLVDSFLTGYDKPDMSISDAYGYARGCLVALMLGSVARKLGTVRDSSRDLRKDVIAIMREGSRAHNDSIHRRLDEIVA